MVTTTHRFALRVALGLYLLGLGFLGGMAAERMRVDARRDAVLRQYDDMLQRWHTVLMEIEKEPDGRSLSAKATISRNRTSDQPVRFLRTGDDRRALGRSPS
jgi:hypothetical protein